MCEIFAIFSGNMSKLFNPVIELTENVSKSGFSYRMESKSFQVKGHQTSFSCISSIINYKNNIWANGPSKGVIVRIAHVRPVAHATANPEG